jgi:carbon storage regulator
MLVLSRRKEEKIVIGDAIEVTIIEIRGDTVKIGVSAPKTVPIYRAELLDAVKQANLEAAAQAPVDIIELAKLLKPK